MNILNEAANWIWLQQHAEPKALAQHLKISPAQAERILQRLHELNVVRSTPQGTWQPTALPAHFFQKKAKSLQRSLTVYRRPSARSDIVGVITPHTPFLTHEQSGQWWLVCDQSGRMGYIHVDTLRFAYIDA